MTPPKSKAKTEVQCLLIFVRIHIFLWLHKTGLSSWLRVTDYWRPPSPPPQVNCLQKEPASLHGMNAAGYFEYSKPLFEDKKLTLRGSQQNFAWL